MKKYIKKQDLLDFLNKNYIIFKYDNETISESTEAKFKLGFGFCNDETIEYIGFLDTNDIFKSLKIKINYFVKNGQYGDYLDKNSKLYIDIVNKDDECIDIIEFKNPLLNELTNKNIQV